MDDQDLAERREEVHRGAQAKRLLEDPLLSEAWDRLEAACRENWETSAPTNHELREELYRMLNATRQARAFLHELIETGDLAALQVNAERKKRTTR